MALTNVISNETAAVDIAGATSFSITGSVTVVAENFEVGEGANVNILAPSGAYIPLTNKEGPVALSAIPNAVVLDIPGTYKITKTATNAGAYVGYEEF